MSKIPLYQSSEQLTTVSPQGVRESPQAAGQAGRDLEGAGEAISQAHKVIREAYDWQQVGSAKLKTLEGMNALEAKAQADGDNTGDFSQYDGEFQRLKSDTLKGITNPAVKAKFEMDFDLQAAQTKTQISAMFRKNMVNKGLANLGTMNEYYTNEYAKTGDPELIKTKDAQIDAYVSKGFIGADDGQKLKTATTLKAKDAQFIFDKENNPALVKEKLDKNTYGFDVITLDKNKDVYDREINKIQGDTADTIILDELNNKPTDIEKIKQLASIGKLDPEWAKNKIKNILNVDDTVKTDPSTYEFIIDMINGNQTKPSVIRNAIETAQANKTLSQSDAKSLYYTKQQGRDTSVYQGYYQETHKQSQFWATAVDSIKRAASNMLGGLQILPTMMLSLVTKAQQKQTAPEAMPELAMQVIKEKLIEENPEIQSFPKGRIGIDRTTGVKYRFYPDGHKERVE